MARPLRLEFPGALYHLTARGNARQPIFVDPTDRHTFLHLLGREIDQQGWRCYAYCLMDNHYHLLIETPDANLVCGMRRFNGAYAQHFNRRHQRVGHLLQGRYKSIIVERDSHLLELARYIVLNPVRAGTVAHPNAWPWSSYNATARHCPSPPWLQAEWLLGQWGQRACTAVEAYCEFVQEGIEADSPWTRLEGQMWLGSAAFRERMAALIPTRSLDNVPACQTRPDRPSADDILTAVSEAYAIPVDGVLKRSYPEAFRAAVYLLRRVANLSLKEVAAMSSVSPSRVSQIQHQVEHGKPNTPLRALRCRFQLKDGIRHFSL